MTKLVDDAQIYQDMCTEVSREDMLKAHRVLAAWTAALEKLDDANDLRTVFLACITTIQTMGPAYCNIAASTLRQHAKDLGS